MVDRRVRQAKTTREAARLAHEAVNAASAARHCDPDRYDALLTGVPRKRPPPRCRAAIAAFMPGLAKGHVRAVETAIAVSRSRPVVLPLRLREAEDHPAPEARRRSARRNALRLARVVLAAIDGHAAGVAGAECISRRLSDGTEYATAWSSATSAASLRDWSDCDRKSRSACRAPTPASAAAPPGSPQRPISAGKAYRCELASVPKARTRQRQAASARSLPTGRSNGNGLSTAARCSLQQRIAAR